MRDSHIYSQRLLLRSFYFCQVCWRTMRWLNVEPGALETCGVKSLHKMLLNENRAAHSIMARRKLSNKAYTFAQTNLPPAFSLAEWRGPYIYSAPVAWFCSALTHPPEFSPELQRVCCRGRLRKWQPSGLRVSASSSRVECA